MASVPRLRSYAGPALLSYGFRPFFLFGAIYAGFAILLWIPVFHGSLDLPTTFSPRDWHVHEMVYGYVPAVMTGFLLTAIPNWTDRLPLRGQPLLLLVVGWAAGRVAVAIAAAITWVAAAAIDCIFLFVLTGAACREIVCDRNWRNLTVLGPVTVLALGNIGFHLEAHFRGAADYGIRIGVASIIVLLTLIGGRIIPSFTRNWLSRSGQDRLPAAFGSLDAITVGFSVLALAAWIMWPSERAVALGLVLVGLLQAVRLARWAGDRTAGERLVLVLHVAYAFLPVGFVLTGIAAVGILPASAGLHAWMVGGAGLMTLAMMTRTTLGIPAASLPPPP